MTAGRAVALGHLKITLPVLVLIIAGAVVGHALGATRLGALVGIAPAWLCWSFQVPRWRDWVLDSGLRAEDVEPLAMRTALIWSKGSLMTRTEFRRRDGQRGW